MSSQHPLTKDIRLIDVMAALVDPIRCGVVRCLYDGREYGWGDISAPVAKSTLSHHMKVLRRSGLTMTREEGTRCFVKLRIGDLESRFPGFLSAFIASAELDDVGSQVSMHRT
ncbi:hypothetical protein [Microbulbifer sp. SAOS-129_SWC]|uniref:ArsR/SmtB family transcription factor n=1 Tax=Microbulbifer sp. SAOS-129_SWC TaxID=3145235 RepID=UPI00321798DF